MIKKKFSRTLALVMIPVVMTAMLAGCGDKDTSEEEVDERIEVTVGSPEVRDISVSSNFSGTVKAESEVFVIPMMAGEVTEKNFEVGDHVNEGDVLFRIDDKAVQIAVEQAEAAVTTAQAGLTAQEAAANATKAQAMQTVGEIPYNERAMNTQVDQAYATKRSANNSLQAAGRSIDMMGAQIEDLESALSSAKKSRSGAEANNKNMQNLYSEYKAASTDEASALAWLNEHGYYGDYATANNAFESVVKQAASSAAAVGSTISELESSIDNLENQKKSAEYNADSAEQQYFVAGESYDLAKMQRDNYNIYGKATTMYGAYAQAVGADSSVTTSKAQVKQAKAGLENAKLQLDYTTVTAPVSGTITAINVTLHNMVSQSGPAYTIQSDAPNKVEFYVAEQTVHSIFPGADAIVKKNGKEYNAKIINVSDMIDGNTGLFKVEASVVENGDELIAGSNVSVSTATRASKNAIIVPVNSVYFDEDQAFVYTEENGIAKRVNVTTGISDETSVEVIEGLTPDARLITSWSSNLKNGVEVRPAGGSK